MSLVGQRVRQRDETHFYFEILTNKENLIDIQQSTTTYNIQFHENRTTFLAQHLALDYMEKHGLVDCLINNPLYGRDIKENPVNFSFL